jgi:short-subunit dehydrogenase
MRRNILITGASSGLGEGMARKFAATGDNLALCARRTDRLATLADELKAQHPGIQVSVRALDVNDHDQVFRVFGEFREELGSLDRVVINAGIGKGQPVGTGRFDANRTTVETNLVAGLAQAEAAVAIFREQNAGHLVVVASFAALRGLPGTSTAYAASKAGVANLAEGIAADTSGTPIKVTTLMPGFIRSEMTADLPRSPLMSSTERGVNALVSAIEKERAKAYIPAVPWSPLSVFMRLLPRPLLRKVQ